MSLILGRDKAVAEWVARRIPGTGDFGPMSAIGVELDGKPIAGAVYHQYSETFGTMMISLAADTPRWARRGNILALLHYPFEQVEIKKLWAMMAMSNERVLRFAKGVGFRQEAIMAKHFGKDHAVVMRMFRKDYYGLKQRMLKDGTTLKRTA